MKIKMTNLRIGVANDNLTGIVGIAADEVGELSFFVSSDEGELFIPMPDGLVVQLHKVLTHYLHCDDCHSARAVMHGVEAAKNSVN